MNKNDFIEAAQQVIVSLGLPRAQQNERSALCLLALLNLTSDKSWAQAENPLIGIKHFATTPAALRLLSSHLSPVLLSPPQAVADTRPKRPRTLELSL